VAFLISFRCSDNTSITEYCQPDHYAYVENPYGIVSIIFKIYNYIQN